MTRLLGKAVLGCGLLIGGVAANAQVYGRGGYENGRAYGEFGRYPDDRYERGGGLFDRVRADLDRAESAYFTSGGDHRRFNKVREELSEFQGKWANGRFDRHELDDVIATLQRVVNDNRMSHRDRDILQDDLYRLRDFRARNNYNYYR